MKIFIYVHFWNGFSQLELVMNRRTSLSGAKGGERRSRDLPKTILSLLREQMVEATTGFTYRVIWLQEWKLLSTFVLF